MKQLDSKLINDFFDAMDELEMTYEMSWGGVPRQIENSLIPVKDFLKELLKENEKETK